MPSHRSCTINDNSRQSTAERAFLHQGLVTDHHWLTERQLTDAVAMGLISPGPVVIMGTFAGYLVASVAGAVVATVALFTPTYLFVVVPGRLFRS